MKTCARFMNPKMLKKPSGEQLYDVRYIVVGTLERQKFPVMAEWKFEQLARQKEARAVVT